MVRGSEKKRHEGKEMVTMKRISEVMLAVLIAVASGSCATAPNQPVAAGEMRLLSIEAPSEVMGNIMHTFDVLFEADGDPRVTRVCLYWTSDGPYCLKPKEIHYGSPGTISFEVRPKPAGVYGYTNFNLECYVEYIRDGKPTRTNSVSTTLAVIMR